VGLRILYLTAIPSGLNDDAFRGMNLAEQLPGAGGDLLVRHWLTGSRDEAVTRNPALAADATDSTEFEAFAPDVVFLEGGLYSNGEDWRVPPDIAARFVENGGVFVVADVDRNEMTQNYASYTGDLRFFGAYLDGYPEDRSQIRYVRDEITNDGHPVSVLCPWPPNAQDLGKEAYDGVGHVLAEAPVALQPRGRVLLWSAPTAGVLSQDRYIDRGRTTALATVSQHGLGYAVMVAASVSSDSITQGNPGNIRWLCNVVAVLHERAALERRLRGASPATSRPGASGPHGERSSSELAQLPEDKFLEHKQTFAFNVYTKKRDAALSDAVLDRICSFWNTEGGTLLVGVEDRTGRVVGLADDLKLFKDLDGFVSHISHRLHEDIPSVAPFIHISIETVDGKSILRIDVPMGGKALFRQDRFFVRNNNTTHELKGEPLQGYLHRRWPPA
jgi:Putative DNA-binding domain